MDTVGKMINSRGWIDIQIEAMQSRLPAHWDNQCLSCITIAVIKGTYRHEAVAPLNSRKTYANDFGKSSLSSVFSNAKEHPILSAL
jgi:hypothetical protein